MRTIKTSIDSAYVDCPSLPYGGNTYCKKNPYISLPTAMVLPDNSPSSAHIVHSDEDILEAIIYPYYP